MSARGRNEDDDAPKLDNIIRFIAFDAFRSHHFTMSLRMPKHGEKFTASKFTSYFGNTESHLQTEAKVALTQKIVSRREDNEIHQDKTHLYRPFFKHSNSQFTIQCEDIVINVDGVDSKVSQYFYLTNDNQYMLVYPNYNASDEKELKKKQETFMKLGQRF